MVLYYSLASGLALTMMYLVYKWFMAGECQHAWNRFMLLAMYFISLVVPLMPSFSLGATAHAIAAVPANVVMDEVVVVAGAVTSRGVDLGLVLRLVYFAGCVGVLVVSTAAYCRLRHIIRGGRHVDLGEGYTLVLTDDTRFAPFSWHTYIVMSQADYDNAGDMIICHENAHIRHYHWVDLLLAQAFTVFMWYNPAAWLMRDELRTVHEYQADYQVLAKGADTRQYQMLLIKKAVGARVPSLANSLNHSKLTQRITMMYKTKTSARRRLRAVALVPAIALALVGINIPAASHATEGVRPAQTTDKSTQKSSQTQDFAWDRLPQFPGGEGAMMKFLSDNLVFPEAASKAGVRGKVVVDFEVGTDGSIGEIQIARSLTPECDNEVIRVVRSMPRWTPASKDGQPIPLHYVLPVDFKLPGE